MGVVGHGAVWFKANPPAGAFEAALTSALSQWVPEHVLEPLAVDVGHGWSLLPDGGDLFRDVLNRGPADPRAWEEPLRPYASMRHALIPHAEEIELLGAPSARTTALPGISDRVIAGNTALRPDDLTRLRELRPRLVDWCMELADVGSRPLADGTTRRTGLRPATSAGLSREGCCPGADGHRPAAPGDSLPPGHPYGRCG